MFTEHLKEVVDNVDGGLGALVMGLDGIAIDSYLKDGQSADIDTICMEYSVLLKGAAEAGQTLEVGNLSEFSVKVDSLTWIARMLTDEFFMAVVLDKDANQGKARFLMRLAHPKLAAEL